MIIHDDVDDDVGKFDNVFDQTFLLIFDLGTVVGSRRSLHQ